MSAPRLLDLGVVPSVEDLVEIIAARDTHHADWLTRGQDITVRLLGDAHGQDITPSGVTSRDVVAVTVTWSTWSDYTGRLLRGEATVIQVTAGGLYGGEGSAEYQQYVSTRALDEHQAAVVASLAIDHGLPVLARRGEL